MLVKPKFRLGQKVIFIKSKYRDEKYDVGYVCGIEVKRSYGSAGIFQWGGLSYSETNRKGYAQTWIDHCDEAVYKIIHTIHTTGATRTETNILESELKAFTAENKKLYPIG